MGRIRILDEQLANQIAAGEVVERPASVIKELVENSLDAGSTIVHVMVENAGLGLMRIVDNGTGILNEDVEKAFARHATSKLQDQYNLFRINTLGFRGEALPSIASVAHVTLKTSTGNEAGTHFEIKGGNVLRHESCSARKGTDISIAQLFFNTPARYKYLKTEATELGKIIDIMNKIALAYPKVAFTVINNGKELLKTTGSGDPLQVFAKIYGIEVAKKMLPIKKASLDYELTGFVGLPELTRTSRNYMTTLVNNRFIRSTLLVKAILEGYHTLLPVNRYPYVLLNVKLDPSLVDVNVHPAKLDVRFSKERELMDLVTTTLQENLRSEQFIPEFVAPPKRTITKNQTEMEEVTKIKPLDLTKLFASNAKMEVKETPAKLNSTSQSLMPKKMINPQKLDQSIKHDPDSKEVFLPAKNKQALTNVAVPQEVMQVEKGNFELANKLNDLEVDNKNYDQTIFGEFAVIGQLHGTYILAQHDDGLYILDQHAVEERLHYEYFQKKLAVTTITLQPLLLPLTFNFSTDQIITLAENFPILEQFGVKLELFGEHSLILREVPTWFPKGQEEKILEELLKQVLEVRKIDIRKLRDDLAKIMSCKASVRANEELNIAEMQQLLNDLYTSGAPMTCPHGRPLAVHFSIRELEKMFKRIM